MSECTHHCETCGAACGERTAPQSLQEAPHELSRIKKVIAVVSGKGGVGKSMVTSLLAVSLQRRGYQTAILDADITGPSIPKAFGVTEKATGSEMGLFPVKSKTGVELMSVNLLLQNETDPVVWRGPVLAGTVKQFWKEVIWNDVDFMFVDLPPGTGDVPLTVFQSLPVAGIVIVTSPQQLVSMIVEKAVKMAEMMHIPVLGVVENMAYYECPNCGERHAIFGESHVEQVAAAHGIAHTARLPIDPKLTAASDKGTIELFEGDWLDGLCRAIEGESDA